MHVQGKEFWQKSACYSTDHEIDHLWERIATQYKTILEQVAKEESTISIMSTPVKEIESKLSIPYHSILSLDLPKFSGKPADWENFKLLFTSVMSSAGASLPTPDCCCHLL